MRNKTFSLHDQSGMSLISVLVAIGMMGLLTSMMVTMNANAIQAVNKATLDDELISVRRVIRNKIDCKRSMAASARCLKPFPPRSSEGEILGESEFGVARIGAWHIRGTCNRRGLELEAARLQDIRTFKLNPLTRKPDDWRPLFKVPAHDAVCGNAVASESDTGPDDCQGTYCTEKKGDWMIVAGPIKLASTQTCTSISKPQLGVDRRLYAATMSCPSGYRPTGGGGVCSVPCKANGCRSGGSQIVSRILPGLTSFEVVCCVYTDSASPSSVPGQGYVTCVKS